MYEYEYSVSMSITSVYINNIRNDIFQVETFRYYCIIEVLLRGLGRDYQPLTPTFFQAGLDETAVLEIDDGVKKYCNARDVLKVVALVGV